MILSLGRGLDCVLSSQRLRHLETRSALSSKKKVWLFTNWHPFPGGEDAFLPAELRILAQSLDVTVIPTGRPRGRLADVPAGVKVDDRLSRQVARLPRRPWAALKVLREKLFYTNIARLRGRFINPISVAKIARCVVHATTVRDWVTTELGPQIDPASSVAYCWWSASNFAGVVMALRGSGVPVVARAHGYDVYSCQSPVGFNVLQAELVDSLTLLLGVSQNGVDYLRQLYPTRAARIQLGRLGTDGPGFVNRGSSDGVFRLLSCSLVVPLKRVLLIAAALDYLRRSSPNLRFEWTHIGDGPEFHRLRAALAANPSLGARVTLLGQRPHDAVQRFYAENPVDLFLNVSTSEGLPVTLMEAASHGVPLMATNAGGSAEIVGPAGGVVLPVDLSPEVLAGEIARVFRWSPQERVAVARRTRSTWEATFSAEKNYSAVSALLASVAGKDEPATMKLRR